MNRRFVLALLLAGLVMFLTPLLFSPTPRAPVSTVGDTTTVPGVRDTTARVADTLPRAASVVPSRPIVASERADTALIETPYARYSISSVGASLIGVELTRYHRLGGDSGSVQLARDGEALLRFRLVVGGDTLPLDRAALTRTADATPDVVTYSGRLDAMPMQVPVQVRWTFAPDTYRVKIAGRTESVGYVSRFEVRVEGIERSAFLLVDLPPGFRTSEADSATDFSHLAYAYKPVANGADLMRFGKPAPGERAIKPGPLTWAVAKSKYFVMGVLAEQPQQPLAELQVSGVPRIGKMSTSGHATVVMVLQNGRAGAEVYAGPLEFRRLDALGREFTSANPYGGWMQGLIQPFSTIVMRVLLWMHDHLDMNYGWTLILFGFFIRIVLWPLNQVALRSSLRMQRIQPELAAAQKKHAGSPEKQREELMRIYREHGMSPFSALSGCLPMLIPMPVLFALFFVFQNTIEFRGVSFWWLSDISQKDPYYILPIVMGASMFVLSWIGARNAPPNPQTKMMMYFLPAMMTVVLINFAAGLNLYYAAQNIAALPQQWMIANERARTKPRSSG
jgi:YidC/Oxa1 family membrane protein insertase